MGRAGGVPLRLFNTLGGKLQEFVPLKPRTARLYACGPTVYAYQHIGNLRAYVFADTLRRVLEWKGHEVVQVINITDVGHLTSDMDEGQDKLQVASEREHRSVWDIAAHYTDAFMHDLRQLRVRPPSAWAKATDHIEEMIAFAQVLEDKGYAYELDSGLYFDTAKVPDYGKLARLDLEGLREGARVAPVPGKRHPADFALWRASPRDARRLMEWDSPWGKGAPGWHLECSTMSMKYLGERFDGHTGGVDHIPVHHTNEIAQSEAYLGGPWVPYWMHNEFINLRGAKISKSKGGTLLLSDLERQGFHPLVYRYLLLGSRYRNQAEFTWDGLEGARIAHRRLLERVRGRVPTGGRQLSFAEAAAHLEDAGLTYLAQLDEAVSADLNTPQALAVVTQFSRDPALPAGELAVLVSAAEALLAIGLLDLAPEDLDAPPADVGVSPEEITRLLDERTEARRRGDFAAADVIRDRLDQVGIELRDTPGGTVWTARPQPAPRPVRLPQSAARPPGTPARRGHSGSGCGAAPASRRGSRMVTAAAGSTATAIRLAARATSLLTAEAIPASLRSPGTPSGLLGARRSVRRTQQSPLTMWVAGGAVKMNPCRTTPAGGEELAERSAPSSWNHRNGRPHRRASYGRAAHLTERFGATGGR